VKGGFRFSDILAENVTQAVGKEGEFLNVLWWNGIRTR
jgi:hypothetical protein